MWPVSIGLKLYWTLSGVTSAAETVPPDFEPIHFFGPVPVAEIAAGVAPLALLITLGIVIAYFFLRRLFGEAVAAVTAALLAFSPYYLAQSKILHLDAWMATLMLLSALALLLFRRERRSLWLLLSGMLGGLALLVKTTALFLVPFSMLVHLADVLWHRPFAIRRALLAVRNLAFWLFFAVLVYVALWPVMWVEPDRGLAAVEWGLTHHASTAHDTPTYFLGRVTLDDPGPIFYGVTLLFRTSEVELTFLAAAAVLGVFRLLRQRRLSEAGVDYALLLAYATFFLAQMGLGAKKMPRYILPALLALDVLAGAGIVAWARALAGRRRRLKMILALLPLLLQAVLILPRHPYYGTAFNWLAGGPQAAARALLIGEEGEGLAELAEYLNDKPDTDHLTVAAQLKHVFNQTFRGTTVDIDQQPVDYLVFHRNYTARDYKIGQWDDLWERYAARTPERQEEFSGVAYAWLYAAVPADALPADTTPEHPLSMRLDDRFQFLGYDLPTTEIAPDDRIPLVLYWKATVPIADDLSIFVHLLDSGGKLVWQDDGAAAHGARPTWSWIVEETIVDPHTLVLPENLPEGDYLLATGIYDWQTGERMSAATLDGEHLDQNQIPVATLTVRQPSTHPAAWVARGLSGLVLLSATVVRWRPNE
jgi:hypothetical protein